MASKGRTARTEGVRCSCSPQVPAQLGHLSLHNLHLPSQVAHGGRNRSESPLCVFHCSCPPGITIRRHRPVPALSPFPCDFRAVEQVLALSPLADFTCCPKITHNILGMVWLAAALFCGLRAAAIRWCARLHDRATNSLGGAHVFEAKLPRSYYVVKRALRNV